MKHFLFLIIMLFSVTTFAQTPFTMMSTTKRSEETGQRVSSFNNAWMGAGLLYNITGEVDGSFILNGRGFYMAASGANYGIPILTNVALNQLDTLNDNLGVRFGVFPYYVMINDSKFKLVGHAGLAYNILDRNDIETKTQFRTLIGLEGAFYPNDNGSPFTLSIAPEYIRSIQNVNDSRWQLSATAVLPIANKLGLLIESQTPFDNSIPGSIQIGVIVATELK